MRQISRDDADARVSLEEVVDNCADCYTLHATHRVAFAITNSIVGHIRGRYCLGCAKRIAELIRRGLREEGNP